MPPLRIAVLVKGYPRLSETFIAQELLGLEARGLDLAIWSLRQPHDGAVHPMHRQIRAPSPTCPNTSTRRRGGSCAGRSRPCAGRACGPC